MHERAPILLEGAGDVHVHTAPSLVPDRKSDLWGLIEACEKHRMAYAVVKWHHGDSFSAAATVDRAHSGPFRLYGGLVLNRTVGGLNPYAVDAAVTLGAKIVWLPTLDAAAHAAAIGRLGGFPFQTVRRTKLPVTGLRITDDRGALHEEVKEILSLIDGTQTVLASGHVSTEEILELKRYIESESLDINLLINHIDFSVPHLTVESVEALASPRVWFELAYFTISSLGHSSIEAIRHLVDSNPSAQFVLASDSGQAKNPICPEAMLELISRLLEGGVDEARLERMLHADTRRLLMLEG